MLDDDFENVSVKVEDVEDYMHVADVPINPDLIPDRVVDPSRARSRGRPVGSKSKSNKPPVKFTPQKKRKFLELLSKTGNINSSAAAVGISRANIYRLTAKDKVFRERVEMAKDKALGLLEMAAIKRGVEGVEVTLRDRNGKAIGTKREFSDRLLIKMMEANDPERHRANNNGNIDINVNVGAQDSAKSKLASLLDIQLPPDTKDVN